MRLLDRGCWRLLGLILGLRLSHMVGEICSEIRRLLQMRSWSKWGDSRNMISINKLKYFVSIGQRVTLVLVLSTSHHFSLQSKAQGPIVGWSVDSTRLQEGPSSPQTPIWAVWSLLSSIATSQSCSLRTTRSNQGNLVSCLMAYRPCPSESPKLLLGEQLLPISIIKMSTSRPLGTNQENSNISLKMNGRILDRERRSLKSVGRMICRRCSIIRIVGLSLKRYTWTSTGNMATHYPINTVTITPSP